MKLRVAFAGTPEFAVPALLALRAHHEVVGVLTQPDRPSGRGRHLTPSAVKRAALEHALPLEQPTTLRDGHALDLLRRWQPQALVVVAYGVILPRDVLALPPLGCINIHASLLPRWRGAAPIQRAILAGDTRTGVSIMQMDAGLDTGPVLLEKSLAIGGIHTAGTLQAELAAMGAGALLEALDALGAGQAVATPQAVEGVTYAAKITKAEALIDWSASAQVIEHQVRGLNPWPVAETRLHGEQLRIYSAQAQGAGHQLDSIRFDSEPNAVDHAINKPPIGLILGVSGDQMIVQCGIGHLAVTQVQRPGRKPVAAAELARGLALTGQRLG